MKVLISISVAVALVIITITMVNVLVIKFSGTPVGVPDVPRQQQKFGDAGQKITYVVMGDSTSIGQGTSYSQSIATLTAKHLAQERTVAMMNVGESGARAKDVRNVQAPQAAQHKPDVVLLSVGANDATHWTGLADFEEYLVSAVTILQKSNPSVKIVVTGSPDMGSVPRFPWPSRQIAGHRTEQLNRIVTKVAEKHGLFFAPIAAETGSVFRRDPTLFASDKFHPNARGYSLWAEVIIKTMNKEI